MTGYETLQQAVADAQTSLNNEKVKLSALQSDGNFIYYKAILADPRVSGNPNAWISGDGTFWQGGDATSSHSNGVAYVNQQNGKIATQQTIINQAQATLDAASKALADYEKSSPIGQQAAASLKDASAKSSLIVAVIVIGIAIVVVAGVVYFIRKNKKKA